MYRAIIGYVPVNVAPILSIHLMCPLDKFPSDTKKCAVIKQHVVVNVLKGILSELSEKSGVGVHYTLWEQRLSLVCSAAGFLRKS